MQGKLRVALVGAGMIANAGHVPAWKNLADDVEIVGVADIVEENARRTASRHGIAHAYRDWEKMLVELRPDVVSVCTPNSWHREPTIGALESGAHVLCEKPIATSYADAEAMYAVAEKVGRILFVGQSSRFSGVVTAARELAEEGRLGEIYYGDTAIMRRRGVPTWGRFHMKEHSGGGPVYDLGVHALDALLWIMGNPRVTAVSGAAFTKLANRDEGLVTSLADSGAPVGVFDPRPYDYHEFDVEDMAAGFMRLEGGGAASLRVSWAANAPDGAGGTMILGTKGGLTLRPFSLITNVGRYQADAALRVPTEPDIPFYGHWKEAEHLVRVIRGEEEPLVKREEVLNVIWALEALYRSADQGCEVRRD